jgi:hypothetical protein
VGWGGGSRFPLHPPAYRWILISIKKNGEKVAAVHPSKYADNSKIGSGVSDKKKKKGSMSVVDLRSEINEF